MSIAKENKTEQNQTWIIYNWQSRLQSCLIHNFIFEKFIEKFSFFMLDAQGKPLIKTNLIQNPKSEPKLNINICFIVIRKEFIPKMELEFCN